MPDDLSCVADLVFSASNFNKTPQTLLRGVNTFLNMVLFFAFTYEHTNRGIIWTSAAHMVQKNLVFFGYLIVNAVGAARLFHIALFCTVESIVITHPLHLLLN
jgi:hypothetical protein